MDAIVDSGWFSVSTARNSNDIQSVVRRLAEHHIGVYGTDPEAAVEWAGKRVKSTHTNINSWIIFTPDDTLPSDLPNIFTELCEAYADKYGESEALDAEDLSMRPINGGAAFEIFNKAAELAVEHNNEDNVGVFAKPFLLEFAAEIQAAADKRLEQAARERQASRAKVFPETITGEALGKQFGAERRRGIEAFRQPEKEFDFEAAMARHIAASKKKKPPTKNIEDIHLQRAEFEQFLRERGALLEPQK